MPRRFIALLSLVIGLASVAGAVQLSGADAARGRRANFDALLAVYKNVTDQLRESSPDAAEIERLALRMRQMAAQLPSWFPAGSGPQSGARTNAKPEIWQNPEDFRRKQTALLVAVSQLQRAAALHDAAAMREAHSTISSGCRACHEEYEDRF